MAGVSLDRIIRLCTRTTEGNPFGQETYVYDCEDASARRLWASRETIRVDGQIDQTAGGIIYRAGAARYLIRESEAEGIDLSTRFVDEHDGNTYFVSGFQPSDDRRYFELYVTNFDWRA